MYSRIDGRCFSHTAVLCLPEALSSSSGTSARTDGELPDQGVAAGGSKLYDVFLSFRGVVRNTFAGHLYTALRNAGVDVFIDEVELAVGDTISNELVRGIEGSRIAVVVLSEHYAGSTWCLQEVAKIMECRRTLNQVVIPVFYGVDPSDVRKQSGSFAPAFESHEVRFKSDLDKVRQWREALTMAANLSGWDTRDRNEAQVIEAIVDDIMRKLAGSTDLFVARYPVGIESRVRELRSMLKAKSDDEVCMLGIWGMGGMGKTTIAKAIYNELSSEFSNKRSFLANIREVGNKPDRLVHLQEQLLWDVLKTKSKIEVGSVARGIELIKSRLHNQKVLIIFDDVDHMSQLDALAGSRNWFGLGSRIIVTTRNRKLLQDLEVDSTYSAPEMNDVESLELFSLHAFRQRKPPAKFSGLSRTVVDYCKGLPLALEVLGSFLSGRDVSEWKRVLKKLKRIPDNNIQEKLRISFDGLDITVKSIFLDIACFFIGMDRSYVLQILEGCDLYPEIGLPLLLERCLVTVNERNKLMMHDLIRDMGRAIVRETSNYKLGEQSRLWCHEDVASVLTKETGAQNVEGITMEMERQSKVSFSTKAFERMQNLRLLQLNKVELTGSYKYLSKDLRWLCWNEFSLKSIPRDFYQQNLVAISMKYSNLRQVWQDPELLDKLEILNLSHSHYLSQTPDFSKLPNLKKLVLKDCKGLYEVHPSIGNLDRLVMVNLKDCKILETLPKTFYKLKSLETLILSGCAMLDALDEALGDMVSLKTLIADNTGIRGLPNTIGQLTNLKDLSLCGSRASPSSSRPSLPMKPANLLNFVQRWVSPIVATKPLNWLQHWFMPMETTTPVNLLPISIQYLKSLTTLCLMDCNLTDDAIPRELGNLSSLVTLRLDNNSFHGLPSSLKGLTRLRSLSLDNCTMLQSILDLPTNLKALYAANCIALKRVPDMSQMLKLVILELANCHELVVIPGLEKLVTSISLELQNTNSITDIAATSKPISLQKSTGAAFSVLACDDIPEWFDYTFRGSTAYFKVPKSVENSLKGFVVCIVYSYSPNPTAFPAFPRILVVNKTQRTSFSFELIALSLHGITCEDRLWWGHISNDVLNLMAGDHVDITLEFGVHYTVKKTGVFLL